MAPVGNTGKKKWIYAVSVIPKETVDLKTLNLIPADATELPFSVGGGDGRQDKRSRNGGEEPTSFFFGQGQGQNQSNKRQRNDGGGAGGGRVRVVSSSLVFSSRNKKPCVLVSGKQELPATRGLGRNRSEEVSAHQSRLLVLSREPTS